MRPKNDLQIEVNDNVITATSSMEILGTHIDSKLNFNGHIAFLCFSLLFCLTAYEGVYLQQFRYFKL